MDAAVSSLAGDLEALADDDPSQRRGPECSVGAILGRLSESDPDAAAALTRALEAPVGATWIAAVLARHGERVQSGTVARHRRRGAPNGCRCPR